MLLVLVLVLVLVVLPLLIHRGIRFNPTHEAPAWYQDGEPEATHRRWGLQWTPPAEPVAPSAATRSGGRNL